MNLKKRFSIANATAVIIPLIFTVLMALAYVFVSENIYGADISFENYQKVSQLRLELVRSENSILKENPEVLEEKSFQEYLQERLDEFGGEYVLMKNSRVIFSSEDLSKIDIAKCLEAGKTMLGEPIIVNNVAYNIQLIDLTYQDDIKGNMILLVPEDKSATSPTSFLLFIAATFIISFI
ncbi:MAG: sensor histidine kinase, partial [Eubacteriales bacterium]